MIEQHKNDAIAEGDDAVIKAATVRASELLAAPDDTAPPSTEASSKLLKRKTRFGMIDRTTEHFLANPCN